MKTGDRVSEKLPKLLFVFVIVCILAGFDYQ